MPRDPGSERRNWVEARAQCTMFGTFDKIITTIRHDVASFNKLPEEDRHGREFDCYDRDKHLVEVVARAERDRGVSVRLNQDSVEVLLDRATQFHVRQAWNAETLECDLTIDGEPTCPWKISQRAIGDFMFA